METNLLANQLAVLLNVLSVIRIQIKILQEISSSASGEDFIYIPRLMSLELVEGAKFDMDF
jgi:hypothetical protein